jgi:iron-sulfur cluster assembly protein
MLTLTDNAVTAIRSLTSRPELPEEAGLRIMAGEDQQSTLQLSLAPNPLVGDEVVESEGARVFMEPGAAQVLDGKALDAQVDNDGGVAFTIADQPPA